MDVDAARSVALRAQGRSWREIRRNMLTARCMVDSKILKIEVAVLRHLLDNDCVMGHALQRHLTDLYFKRYIGTMQKLQAVVISLPVEPE